MATRQDARNMNWKPIPALDKGSRAPASEEHIRARAYMHFEERSRAGVPGDATADWLRAQCELNQTAGQAERTQLVR